MKQFLIKGNYIAFYLLIIILLLFKSTKQQNGECKINGYNESTINETICKEFTYLFDNLICDYNTTNNKCLNIEEKEYKNNKSKYNSNYIVNNCGISGFYEPIDEGPCKNIQLVEGLCCFVKYGNDNGTENHTACLRTSESEKEKGESYFKNYNYTENFNFIDAKCKEKYIELWLSILFVSLLFLI